MKDQGRDRIQWLSLLGIVGVLFYFLHVIMGQLNYPGYNPLAQAVSDLTAANAPSKVIASSLSGLYGVFTVVACTLFCVFYKDKVNKVFRIGVYLFVGMQWLSNVGYTLFPLSDSGYAGAFQDVMHMIVTAGVVLLTIASLILITIGAIRSKVHKSFGVFTLIILGVLTIGAIGTGVIPREYFGVTERLSVFSVVVYTGALSWFTFKYAH